MAKPGTPQDLDDVRAESKAFPFKFRSVLLATVDGNGIPNASYAPFVNDQGKFYIFISELSLHTKNLLQTQRCSALFIDNEDHAANIFARSRLTLQCQALEVPRDTEAFKRIMPMFDTKFGKFMDVIKDLKDFHLIELTPVSGGYVNGFAKAYTLTGDDLGEIKHRNEQGHHGRTGEPL